MNDLFLYSRCGDDSVVLGIGTRSSKRRVALTADEARKLAYRLMSLAAGGETQGMERFGA